MSRVPAALAVLLLTISSAAWSDLHIVSEVSTSESETIIVEQWLGDALGYRRQDNIAYLTDLNSKELLLIDHDQRTVTRYVLVDPEPLGAFQFEAEATGRSDTVGKWQANEYRVTDSRQPGVTYMIWSTGDAPHLNDLYRKFVRQVPGGDAITMSLGSMEGLPVRIETIIESPDGVQSITTEVVTAEIKEPPRGIYDIPKGYYVD